MSEKEFFTRPITPVGMSKEIFRFQNNAILFHIMVYYKTYIVKLINNPWR